MYFCVYIMFKLGTFFLPYTSTYDIHLRYLTLLEDIFEFSNTNLYSNCAKSY